MILLRRRLLLIVLPLAVLLSLLLFRQVSETTYSVRQNSEDTSIASRLTDNRKEHGFTSSSLRVVHLDLKGAPPKISYLLQLLPLLAANGCTGLLIEYEDMFPYQGSLVNISAKNAYTQQQIIELVSWAQHLGLEVIPLIQTFGHMEFVLKLPEFRHLRELDTFPQEVCPRASGTLDLLQEMIRQVMGLHSRARYLHIGCDEVYHLAVCPRCTHSGRGGREIFTEHVTQVAELVKSEYPEVTPIIWDDMLRRWDPVYLSRSSLGVLVEPMVWAYSDNITRLVPHYLWYWYSKTFPRIWVAGAFKGANLPTSVLPDVRLHYNNQKSWLRFLARSNTDTKIAGYVLTGWSRYDHFAILCELLPPSIPSLLLNLILVSTQESDNIVLDMWKRTLKCGPRSKLTVDLMSSNHRPLALDCSFPGLKAFLVTSKYMSLKSKVDHFYKVVTEQKAWMTPYNVKYNFTSPYRVLEEYRLTEGYQLIKEIKRFRNETKDTFSEFFDDHTIEEWIEQRIVPMDEKLTYLETISNKLLLKRTWPRRPFS
ncbi:hexosaminidase D-like [Homalodisca vitripennis]|uniref:hexosaminidase D-like n=1 Tax=Homalodisca vitripennis TaxID=197043 RepID=UPI001EE9FFE1|nr:hexosaminidase D-like [Homalodisca vitripennis]XP_046667472.1 hexosaminidase D-like [Homalodisca vitripennis]XP_046667473.1 hexosaminidase D-like [Homalodisca vitripennis]XP_046667474.1 hexosaminidase D-like [Homalodisca vitripennis]